MCAGHTVRKQAQLLALDPVLHITPGAVLFVVELEAVVVPGVDNEPGIGAPLAFFQAGHRRETRYRFRQSPTRFPPVALDEVVPK